MYMYIYKAQPSHFYLFIFFLFFLQFCPHSSVLPTYSASALHFRLDGFSVSLGYTYVRYQLSPLQIAAPVAERLRALFLTAVPDAGSSPALATFERSQVLLAGVPGVSFSGFSRFRPPADRPVSYELK